MDLEKFPASKVRQLAKKMEISKATACHIKQVAGDPQAVQINLMMHQCTEISSGKNKKRKSFVKPKQPGHKNIFMRTLKHQVITRRALILRVCTRIKIGIPSVEIQPIWKFPAKKFQYNACHKFGHFTSLCYQKKQSPFKSRRPKAHQLPAGTVYVQDGTIYGHFEDYSSSNDSFCLQIKMQVTQASLKKIPTHQLTSLIRLHTD